MREASHRRRLRARHCQSADHRSRHRRGRIMILRTLVPGKPGLDFPSATGREADAGDRSSDSPFGADSRRRGQRSTGPACHVHHLRGAASPGRSWWSSARGPVLAVQQPSTATLARSGGHARVSRPAREPVSHTRRRRLLRGERTRRVSLAVRIRSLLASIVERATINDADIAVFHGSSLRPIRRIATGPGTGTVSTRCRTAATTGLTAR